MLSLRFSSGAATRQPAEQSVSGDARRCRSEVLLPMGVRWALAGAQRTCILLRVAYEARGRRGLSLLPARLTRSFTLVPCTHQCAALLRPSQVLSNPDRRSLYNKDLDEALQARCPDGEGGCGCTCGPWRRHARAAAGGSCTARHRSQRPGTSVACGGGHMSAAVCRLSSPGRPSSAARLGLFHLSPYHILSSSKMMASLASRRANGEVACRTRLGRSRLTAGS